MLHVLMEIKNIAFNEITHLRRMGGIIYPNYIERSLFSWGTVATAANY